MQNDLSLVSLVLFAAIFLVPVVRSGIPPWIGTVSRIADGDSVEARLWFTQRRIRLSGFDAPEWKQAYGREARTELVSMIQNRRVLFFPVGLDRYDRAVCAVLTLRGPVSWRMVASGAGWADSIPTALISLFPRLLRRGLWADRAAMKPSIWRALNPR